MNISIRRIIIILISLVWIFITASCSISKRGVRAKKSPHQNTTQVHYQHHKLSKQQKLLLEEADSWIGTPYIYGGEEKGMGADCSGFVMQVYLQALNKRLPRNSAKQALFCNQIKEEEVRIGDLVFFATGKDTDKITHVGIIYNEDGEFIHASSSKGVCISSISNPWYRKRFKMYGRIPD